MEIFHGGSSRWKSSSFSWRITSGSCGWVGTGKSYGSSCRGSSSCGSQATASAVNRPAAEDGKSWWKLFPKPPTLDHSTRGGEIATWKEWSWTFEQYISSVDAKFAEDIQKLREHPERPIDPVDFNDMEKQRNTFFYSLLSSLLGQRALLVVRQVSGCNGLEAYRTLIQQNEPVSKNRSMGLLNVIMNWPAFSGKLSLMQHDWSMHTQSMRSWEAV